ncbi:MAG: hypothetical protein ACI9V8_000682 [Urechidicola sp.]|jgi:hypothetical protein
MALCLKGVVHNDVVDKYAIQEIAVNLLILSSIRTSAFAAKAHCVILCLMWTGVDCQSKLKINIGWSIPILLSYGGGIELFKRI